MSQADIEIIERRRTFIRVGLFFVIIGTMPFYLLGFILWGTTPDRNAPQAAPTSESTAIRNTETNTPLPSNTFITLPTTSPLGPTPGQFNPPPVIIRTNTPPPVFIPTSTFAPTITPFPTNTPLPTNTQVITIPTFTPEPTATDVILLPPTDTPPPPETTASP
ncbi:MAG: hypothetical protein KJ043_01370 [Anaerolineae bacterium]|nr:hypothetical protein [Anaerolineae bacterium]